MSRLTQPGPVRVDAPESGAPAFPDAQAWGRYYEDVYQDAGGQVARVPWGRGVPNPSLAAWLTTDGPCLLRTGGTVCVVGCGLGDDVRDLCDRGYDAAGFDVSPTAIEWCRSRHADIAERFSVADLFALPAAMVRRWDLVVEINTLQALHPDLRAAAATGVASLARPRGTVLVICRGRSAADSLPAAPPYPLSVEELTGLFAPHGLRPTRSPDDFLDDEMPPVRRLRAALRRE